MLRDVTLAAMWRMSPWLLLPGLVSQVVLFETHDAQDARTGRIVERRPGLLLRRRLVVQSRVTSAVGWLPFGALHESRIWLLTNARMPVK